MKKNIAQVLIFALIFLAGYQTAYLISKKKYEKELDGIINIYASEEAASDEGIADSESFNGIDLSDASLYSSEGEKVEVPYKQSTKTIFARYSSTGCRPCIDHLTKSLKEFTAQHPDWHVNLLIDNIPIRDLYVLSKDFGSSFTLYSTEGMETELGNSVSPVIFRVDSEGKVFRHFTCSPDRPERTTEYIAHITL